MHTLYDTNRLCRRYSVIKFDFKLLTIDMFANVIFHHSGLLGGHTAAKDLQEQYGRMPWYQDELLTMAKEVGYRLLPAFNTSTGVPYPKVRTIPYSCLSL